MTNRRWLLSREFAARSQAQAVAFDRKRLQTQVRAQMQLEEIVAALASPLAAAVFIAAGRAFALKRELDAVHRVIAGGTGTGKSTLIRSDRVQSVITSARAVVEAVRRRHGDLDAAAPELELVLIDPKDDGPMWKATFAAAARLESPEVRRVLHRAFLSIEWQRDRVTPRPLLVRHPEVSVEFQSELTVAIIVLTSPADWSATTEALLFQVVRLLYYRGFPFDLVVIRVLLTVAAFRLSILDGLPSDLRDYFGRLQENAAAQTIAALLRRLQILLSYPEVRAMLSLPASAAVDASWKPRRIVIADCGTRTLPPTIGHAQANALITEVGLTAGTRDRSIEKVVFVEEAAYVLSQSIALLSRFLNVLRLLRSTRTSVWFAVQTLQRLPASAVEEILTNVGTVIAFQSRDDIANMLFPHLYIDASDVRRESERRAAFVSELASLPQREAILWVKGHPAFRTRIADAPDPATQSGIPHDELVQMFDEELAAGSTISIEAADRLLDAWRAEHLPTARIPRADAAAESKPSIRSIFGMENEP